MTTDELTALRVGDRFVYRGRMWVLADYAGWTWGADERGEFARFKCWPERGGPTVAPGRPTRSPTRGSPRWSQTRGRALSDSDTKYGDAPE